MSLARQNRNAQSIHHEKEETMKGRLELSGSQAQNQTVSHHLENVMGTTRAVAGVAPNLAQLPASLRESATTRSGEYDARRLRSQREVIRDVMLAAADCDTWLTLSELRALTRYGEASI
jgi:hypothetical protein